MRNINLENSMFMWFKDDLKISFSIIFERNDEQIFTSPSFKILCLKNCDAETHTLTEVWTQLKKWGQS